MAAEGYLQPFDSIGITPPRGRAGHSVPLPRPLTGASLKPFGLPGAVSGGQLQQPEGIQKLEAQVHYPGAVGLSPAQFYVHRDHTLGGSVSRLDRLRTHQEFPFMETFAEVEEEEENGELEKHELVPVGGSKPDELDEVDSGRPVSHQSLQSGDLGQSRRGRQMSITLDKFTGDSLLHFSYSAVGGGAGGMLSESSLGGSFVRAFTQGLNSSLNVPFVHQNTSLSSPSGDTSALFPTASRNPNKAIITIDAQSSRILVANEMTCELFGYQKDELSGMKVQNLFTEPYRTKQQALVEQNIDSSGAPVLISGKVMDAVTAYGVEFPVSVWMKRVAGASPITPPTGGVSHAPLRVIVVIEPVERSSAFFTMDQDGKIVSCDPWFAVLFGFSDSPEVIDKSILEFIPSLKLPTSSELTDKGISKQAATGRTKDDTVFPLTVKFTDVSQNLSVGDLYSPSSSVNRQEQILLQKQNGEEISGEQSVSPSTADEQTGPSSAGSAVWGDRFCINAKVIVYAALSGMISFLPDGTIYGCNHHFAVMLFGYSQEELLKKDITLLIPEFYNHINYVDDRNMPLPPLDEEELFHDVMEHSFTPDSALGLIKNWNLGPKVHYHHSPVHKKSSDFQHSPAKKILNFQDIADDAHMDVEGVPLSLSEVIKEAKESQDHDSQTSSTHHNVRPQLTTSDTVTGTTVNQEDADPLAIIDDLAKSNLARQQRTSDNITRPLSSMSEPHHGTGGNREVPKKLVPSASTERIMDILRERGLDVGGQNEGERKRAFNESLEEVAEELYSSDHEEEMVSPRDCRDRFSSSTPAAEKSEEYLQQQHRYHRGSQAEGVASPPHLFSVGSSPVHGSNQELHRRASLNSLVSLPEGTYLGEARHKDGSLMSIVFQLKPISLADGKKLFCVWISRDLDCERARTADLSMSMSRPPPDPYRTNQIISPDVAVPGMGVGVAGVSAPARRISDPVSGRSFHAPYLQSSFNSNVLHEEILAMEGEYSVSYDTLSSIGKGAFGFVRLAQRKEDGLLVVVKFLRKSSVLKDCWVDDEEMGRVPREIRLLARLSHPNIVQLLEAYENEHFFQMVMEKHGDGLDLFEFIERNPRLDEPIISYMFRQIVAGLSYLHERNILHRDIKDENIIVDRQFTLKLIDFGSAAYMEPGKKFNTFCGTLEYCSPEVLLGNNYSGPELEMWALGVTLYTLVFGENPFFDVEETISGHLQPPFLTSPALMKVVFWLLHPDPNSRATLKDLRKDKWTNQPVDIALYSFESVLGYASSGSSHGHTQAVPPAIMSAPTSKNSHFIKSNSETDACQLGRALQEQLQFREGDKEDKKI